MKRISTKPSNPDRCRRVEQALAIYSDDDLRTNLVDFLADAMHWCRANGHYFTAIANSAQDHFEAEVLEGDGYEALPNQAIDDLSDAVIDIHKLLATRHSIALIWCIEDVQGLRPDLTDEQAWVVLKEVEACYDAEVGVSLDTLDYTAGMRFPENDEDERE